MVPIRTNGVIGSERARIDGMAKVTGQACYGADQLVTNPAYAYLATASIARGRIRKIESRLARSMPGVLDILTYENVGKAVKPGRHILSLGYMATALAPLRSNRIYFAGQIVAVVVAETFETAQAAAQALSIVYKTKKPAATFDCSGVKEVKLKSMGEPELSAGHFDQAFAASPFTVDAWYETPAQHHNPLELFQTTCAWTGEQLTVWESNQNVRAYQHGLAQQLGLKPKNVRILSPFIGGAFGSRGELGQATALIALAAKRLNRPVKLVASRPQGFTLRTFRAETRHHLQLGADHEGRLTALSHESWELTSRTDRFALAGSDSTSRLYACPNVHTKVHNVEADRQTPGYMRAPPETPYLFPLESAMDELAYQFKMDPLELRRRNDTLVETVTGKPYTSRSLLRCMEAGAEAFGWSQRNPCPGSMRDGDDLVGWGYATAFYPTMMGPAECRVTLTPDLRAIVEVGTHEIGTGIRTVIAQTAGDLLGIEVEAVEVRVGDSALPAVPLSAGSNSTASVCTVVAKACSALRRRIIKSALAAKDSSLHGAESSQVVLQKAWLEAKTRAEPLGIAVRRAGRDKPMVESATNNPHGAPPLIGPALIRRGKPIIKGGAMLKDRMQFAFGAQFVEIHINRWTKQIRVPRMVGAFAAGRIMNPKTARSQLAGGQIWGMSAALLESTDIDHRTARYVNDNLADYQVPVNADITEVKTLMLDEQDVFVNPLGIKGVGELGITGMNAAVANAVYHATGIRCRKLPIRIEHLLAGPW
ncbi:MAG: xanthine dehydrogenase family protein molybdopterin-binding subunit [Acidobacteriaceae bacterium]|nr:xanthine dehydrogenase family protein molybdopterin-binding subunit [Acidobacteriaceae bacterium]